MSVERELAEILSEIEETLRVTGDPFKVRVRELLDRLSNILSRADVEHLPFDAEILMRVSDVIKYQGERLNEEASAIALGRLAALIKAKLLSPEELAYLLISSWRPIVSQEQVTLTDLMRSLEYLEYRLRTSLSSPQVEAERVERPQLILSETDVRARIEEVRGRINRLLASSPIVRYVEAVRGENLYETYVNAFAVALLASMGEISILYDPFEGAYFITRAAGEGEIYSTIVLLEEVVGNA